MMLKSVAVKMRSGFERVDILVKLPEKVFGAAKGARRTRKMIMG
jgi:hypothetical protein